MEQQIKAILAPFQAKGIDAGCEFDGTYWQVWIGPHGGARKDGVGLATFLAEHASRTKPPRSERLPNPDEGPPLPRRMRVEPEPAPVPEDIPIAIPDFLKEPEDPRLEEQAARIAELEARLAEKAAEANAPPADIADLIDVADTPAETNGKLLAKWNEVNGLIQLAHDRGERPSMDLIRKRDRLESGIRWNRGRSAEQI